MPGSLTLNAGSVAGMLSAAGRGVRKLSPRNTAQSTDEEGAYRLTHRRNGGE